MKKAKPETETNRRIGDPIRPKYYQGDLVMRIIEHFKWSFCLGTVFKYIARAGVKTEDRIEDLKKARWYLDREIHSLENPEKETVK